MLIVEMHVPGGQAGTSSRIENYPGFPDGISGGELAARTCRQARRLGVIDSPPIASSRSRRRHARLDLRLHDDLSGVASYAGPSPATIELSTKRS